MREIKGGQLGDRVGKKVGEKVREKAGEKVGESLGEIDKLKLCHRITCILCLQDGRSGDMSTTYYGESCKNMHCRAKEHASKFHSKKEHIRNESAFHKHLMNTHDGRDETKSFSDYFQIVILKAYKKAFNKCVEEWTYISNHGGEIMNSKSEWHQAKVVRVTSNVVQGGADVLGQLEGGGRQGGAPVQEPRAPGTRSRTRGT